MLPIKGYEGRYEICSSGAVFSLRLGDFLKPATNPDTGYLHVSLWANNQGRSFNIHRLVAEHFIPNPDNLPEVNHKDGVRTNNDVGNLEWVTSSGNSYHAVRTGLRVYSNRLTRDQFLDCLQDVIQGESYASVSQRVPYKVPFLSTKLRKIAREEGLETQLDASLKAQRIERARRNLPC